MTSASGFGKSFAEDSSTPYSQNGVLSFPLVPPARIPRQNGELRGNQKSAPVMAAMATGITATASRDGARLEGEQVNNNTDQNNDQKSHLSFPYTFQL